MVLLVLRCAVTNLSPRFGEQQKHCTATRRPHTAWRHRIGSANGKRTRPLWFPPPGFSRGVHGERREVVQ